MSKRGRAAASAARSQRGGSASLCLLLLSLGVPATAPADEVRYTIASGQSRVSFETTYLGLFTITGHFAVIEGTVMLDTGGTGAAAIAARIPVQGLRLHSAGWTERLQGPAFFDAARFPDIRFAASGPMPAGPATAMVRGTLRLHGMEQPLQLEARVDERKPAPGDALPGGLHISARAALRRSDFALGAYAPFVSDRVALSFDLVAEPTTSAVPIPD